MEKVKSLNHLKKILNDGETRNFFIQLNFGLRSSKSISYDGENFYVFNWIDSTEEEFTEEQLMNEEYTNIGRAIRLHSLFLDD